VTVPEHIRRHWPDTLISLAISAGHGGLSTLLPPMFRDEGKGAVSIGALVAVSAVMALAMRVPGGLLYKPGRVRWIMVGSLVLTSLAVACYPNTTDNGLLTLIGAVDGIGFSAATTVNMAAMIESISPTESRPGAISFFVSGMSFGFAFSGFVWSAVADAFGFPAAFYGIIAAYGIAALLALFSRHVEAAAPRAIAAVDRPPVWRRAQTFGALLLDPVVTFVIMGAFFLNVFLSQFQTFLPLTLLPLGISLTEVGGLRSAWSMTNALGRIFGGPVLGVLNYRRTQNLCLLLQATLLALFALPLPLAVYGVITVGAASGRAVCYVANAMALSEVDPNRIGRGVASGIMNAAGDLGNILGPVSGGLIAAVAGYQKFWLISPPLYLAIYFGVLLVVRRRASVPAPVAAA